MNIIENIIKKMKEGESFKQAIKSLSFQFVTIEGLAVDCNMLNLESSILNKISSIKEIKKLFYKKIQNSRQYIENGKKFIDNFNNKKIKEAGKYIGKIISMIFDFNVK